MNRTLTLALTLSLTLLFVLATPVVAAALPGWTTMRAPLRTNPRLEAVDTFGSAGVVVAGAGAAVAVSGNGGASWKDISAGGLSSASLLGVAFTDAEHGVVVGRAGTILVGAPDDLEVFGWSDAAVPGNVTGDLRDVALSGSRGFAIGEGGVILATDDGGASWSQEKGPTAADLNAVALSADGDVAAVVGAQGTLLVNDGGSWGVLDTGTSADLLDVALSAAGTVYCCSADRVYSLQGAGPLTALPAVPLPVGGSMSSLALVENGTSSRLVAGGSGGWLAGISTSGAAWARQTGGGTSAVTALAAAGGGVCYATTAAGRLERGLNAGRTYSVALTATPAAASSTGFRAIVTIGRSVALSGSATILAPGVMLLEARPKDASTWRTIAGGNPGSTTIKTSQTPTVNTVYRLRFLFAGATAATGREVSVGVRHGVRVSTTSIAVRRGDVYRVSGSVSPTKTGGTVEVWTDRAGNNRLGSWHRISVGGYVKLVSGTAFTTRRFGTPVRETYHLKILMRGDSQHLQGWSPRITVAVR